MEIVKNMENNEEYDYYELHYLDEHWNEVPKEEAKNYFARYFKDGVFIKESFGNILTDEYKEKMRLFDERLSKDVDYIVGKDGKIRKL